MAEWCSWLVRCIIGPPGHEFYSGLDWNRLNLAEGVNMAGEGLNGACVLEDEIHKSQASDIKNSL